MIVSALTFQDRWDNFDFVHVETEAIEIMSFKIIFEANNEMFTQSSN